MSVRGFSPGAVPLRVVWIALALSSWICLWACGAEDGGGGSSGSRTGDGSPGGDGFGNAGSGSAATDPSSPFGNPTTTGVAGGVAAPVGGAGDDRTCAEGEAQTAPVTPTVWLVLDSSGSMDEPFGPQTRWQALRSALMDPGGVVSNLEAVVEFGMVIYNGNDAGGCDSFAYLNPNCGCLFGFEPACCTAACGYVPTTPNVQQCVGLSTVDPALNNYLPLDAAFPRQQNGGWTPTDRALEHVVQNLPIVSQDVLDADVGPVYTILATDGAPNDHCGGAPGGGGGASGFQPEVAQRVLDAVNTGRDMGMKMFVISLAGSDPELSQHLSEVAVAGDTGQAPFEPASRDDLIATLRRIIGEAACQVALNGAVHLGDECRGAVTLNGNELGCNDENGWSMSDERTVRLTGTACDSFLTTRSQVLARFPCGVFTPD